MKALLVLVTVPTLSFVLLCWGLHAWGLAVLPDGITHTTRTYTPELRNTYWASLCGKPPIRIEPTDPVREGWRIARLLLGARDESSLDRTAERQVTAVATRQLLAQATADHAPSSNLHRHAAEHALRIRISHWTPSQVIDSTLATGVFGRDAIGIDAGTKAWFDKDVAQLSAHQAAALMVLSRGPSYYDPGCRRDRFLDRYKMVLEKAGISPDPDASIAFGDHPPACPTERESAGLE